MNRNANKNSKISISIVVPCYNEEDNVKPFLDRITPILEDINLSYEIIFINDGSSDNTLNILKEQKQNKEYIRILNLSRNFGKEAALTAGLEHSIGEVAIPIDADLQHPPELIIKFIEKWREGYDVVAAKRTTRTGESGIKKLSAKLFYNLNNRISDIEIPRDIGDFRLMSRKVIEALKDLPENQRFMKGIFAWLGFKTTIVKYEQEERQEGESSFNAWKLWNFAIDGITSFSTAPLRVWFYIGLVISFISFLLAVSLLIQVMMDGIVLPGYVSTITMVLFLGGIQLIGIGILGEYIGRIYMESKRRPTYIIEDEY